MHSRPNQRTQAHRVWDYFNVRTTASHPHCCRTASTTTPATTTLCRREPLVDLCWARSRMSSPATRRSRTPAPALGEGWTRTEPHRGELLSKRQEESESSATMGWHDAPMHGGAERMLIDTATKTRAPATRHLCCRSTRHWGERPPPPAQAAEPSPSPPPPTTSTCPSRRSGGRRSRRHPRSLQGRRNPEDRRLPWTRRRRWGRPRPCGRPSRCDPRFPWNGSRLWRRCTIGFIAAHGIAAADRIPAALVATANHLWRGCWLWNNTSFRMLLWAWARPSRLANAQCAAPGRPRPHEGRALCCLRNTNQSIQKQERTRQDRNASVCRATGSKRCMAGRREEEPARPGEEGRPERGKDSKIPKPMSSRNTCFRTPYYIRSRAQYHTRQS